MVTCLFSALAHQQYMELTCGEDSVQYNLVDARDENEGFVMTLKREYERIKYGKRESSGARDPARAGPRDGTGKDVPGPALSPQAETGHGQTDDRPPLRDR
ncbi:MAG: hypothetical protein NTW87_25525 [Planctomycetota bacterium]|nr:hypothetical protein [Planctomycetota bacterium]